MQPWVRQRFLTYDIKCMIHKREKKDKVDFIRINNFDNSDDVSRRMKSKPQTERKDLQIMCLSRRTYIQNV